MPTQNKNSKPSVTILCSGTAVNGSPFGNKENSFGLGTNAVFTFAHSVSKERQDEILSDLKNEAGVVDAHSCREIERMKAENTVMANLPILLCFLALVAVGVICSAVLTMIKNKRTFRAYIICGMGMKKGVILLSLYTGLLLIIAALMVVPIWALLALAQIIPWYSMVFGAPSVIFAFAEFIISGMLIISTSLPVLKKYESNGVEK